MGKLEGLVIFVPRLIPQKQHLQRFVRAGVVELRGKATTFDQ